MAPHAAAITVMLPLLTATWLAPVNFHHELGRLAKYMDFSLYVLAAGGVFSFALGAFLAAQTCPAARPLLLADAARLPAVCRLLRVLTWVLFGLTFTAYVVWFIPVFRDPSIITDVFAGRGAERDVRTSIGTIPGLTTLVQAQIPYITLLALRWLYLPQARPSRLEKLSLASILMLTFLRNFVWSERIAMLEALVPMAVLFFRKPRFPALTAFLPLLAVVVLFIFFGTFEYFRSWSAYYKYQYDSFWVFVWARLAGYYITALDNGAGLIHGWGNLAALSTADWFWRFPWEIGQTFLSKALGVNPAADDSWLYWNASPEFNNASGIYMPFDDFGKLGGMLFWFFFGILTGVIYRGFILGSIAGMLIYPSWFIGILEMPRILYLCEARYFPVLMIFLATLFMATTVAAQESRAGPRASPA